MSHVRLRKFNTRDAYPEQTLDNDLCMVGARRQHRLSARPDRPGSRRQDCRHRRPGGADRERDEMREDPAGGGRRAGSEHIIKITIYITDRAYREPVYQVVGKWLKGVYPVSTGLIVQGLARPEYLMEIDVIAEIPAAPSSRLGASAGKQAPKIEHWILRGDWRCGRLHKEWYGTRLADHLS